MSIGILLFQDLAVVPLLILLPALAGDSSALLYDLALALGKVAVVMAALFFVGQRLVRPWFHLVARQRSSELFMINVLLVTLSVSWLTEMAGISLALGAFVAGMLISETPYRYQVEEDIRPFRDILLGFFFITIGMRLEIGALAERFWLVFAFVAVLIPLKLGLVYAIARAFKYRANDSLKTAIALGQGGEFGFVLIALAGNLRFLPPAVEQAAIASVLISMLAAPFLIQQSARLVRLLIRSDWETQAADLHSILVSSMMRNEHAIICGYGRSGQALARLLEKEDMPFFALDTDPERVREAGAAGDAVVFGHAGKKEVLLAAGLMRAKAVVITFADTHASMQILQVVHELRPDLPVIVRTIDDSDIDKLRDAGADEVVAEVMEGSLMLASQALMAMGVPLNRVLRRIRNVREERYNLFRGFFHGMTDETLAMDDGLQPRLATVLIRPGSVAVGQPIAALELDALDVQVRAVKRRLARISLPEPSLVLEVDDVLVLLGTPDQLAAVELMLLEESDPAGKRGF